MLHTRLIYRCEIRILVDNEAYFPRILILTFPDFLRRDFEIFFLTFRRGSVFNGLPESIHFWPIVLFCHAQQCKYLFVQIG